MNYFLKTNKNFVTYALICLLIIPFFGLNFLISFISNILLLLILIPLLLLIITFISFNSLKSKINTCNQCGTISLGSSKSCMKCGAEFDNSMFKKNQPEDKASDITIEVKAEEIK